MPQAVVEEYAVGGIAAGDHHIEIEVSIDIAEGYRGALQFGAEGEWSGSELAESFIDPDLAGGCVGGDTGIEITVAVDVAESDIGTVITGQQCLTGGAEVTETIVDPHDVTVGRGASGEGLACDPRIEIAVAIDVSQCHCCRMAIGQCLTATGEVSTSVVEQDVIASRCGGEVAIEIAVSIEIAQGEIGSRGQRDAEHLEDSRLAIEIEAVDGSISIVIDLVVADLRCLGSESDQ